jgi:hypothetical protein
MGSAAEGATLTEAEWRACTDPTAMLEFLRGRVSDRKLWLFGCACCRRIWPLLPQVSKEAAEAGEAYADGLIPHTELMDASVRKYRQADASGAELSVQAAMAANLSVVDPSRNGYPAFTVAQAARICADKVVLALGLAGDETGTWEGTSKVEVAGGERLA